MAGPDAPLVLDDAGRLYLRRYYELEARLARALLTRTESPDTEVDAAWLAKVLDRHFGGADGEENLQREAVSMAVRRPFAIISGGPGTGKTSTVVKLLAVLLERSVVMGANVPRVLMAAPTGKAAARLSQSILSAVGTVERMAESDLDLFTGVAGSGPAYVFFVAEALTDAAVAEGMSRPVAERVIRQLLLGSATLLDREGDPAVLRQRVTSPGGTTAAGLAVLDELDVRGAFGAAVRAATARSRELG